MEDDTIIMTVNLFFVSVFFIKIRTKEEHTPGPRHQGSGDYVKHGDFLLSNRNSESMFEYLGNGTCLTIVVVLTAFGVNRS